MKPRANQEIIARRAILLKVQMKDDDDESRSCDRQQLRRRVRIEVKSRQGVGGRAEVEVQNSEVKSEVKRSGPSQNEKCLN